MLFFECIVVVGVVDGCVGSLSIMFLFISISLRCFSLRMVVSGGMLSQI